jgi:hypothetical protein
MPTESTTQKRLRILVLQRDFGMVDTFLAM